MVTPTRRAQRRAQLTAGRFGQFTRTKQVGEGIDFDWPCTNSGDGEGVAFIKVREPAIGLVWDGAPFPIPVGQTVTPNLHQTIDLPLGLRSMIPELHEGLPPNGIRLIASDTLALTVVSNPVLATVGNPKINNLDGPTFFEVKAGTVISLSWPCQNSGGGAGRARLRDGGSGVSFLGPLITISGFSTVVLLGSYISGSAGKFWNRTLTMEDDKGTILSTWVYSFKTI